MKIEMAFKSMTWVENRLIKLGNVLTRKLPMMHDEFQVT